MLSSVLRSPRAVAVNVQIMRTFVRLRRMLSSNTELLKKLNALERKYDGNSRLCSMRFAYWPRPMTTNETNRESDFTPSAKNNYSTG